MQGELGKILHYINNQLKYFVIKALPYLIYLVGERRGMRKPRTQPSEYTLKASIQEHGGNNLYGMI